MNTDCLLSIIVPVYNVEKYIVDCLRSLEMQTYKDFEVILINDGSTDNSLEKIYKYIILPNQCQSKKI